jgi:hypothetical protein
MISLRFLDLHLHLRLLNQLFHRLSLPISLIGLGQSLLFALLLASLVSFPPFLQLLASLVFVDHLAEDPLNGLCFT